MSGLKKGRGRPKRNNIKVLQQHQINESHATCASILPIDVKQPLTIYRTAATRPEEKVEELQERDNSAATTTTTTTTVEEEEVSQGVQLSRLPKVGFTQQKTTNIMDENNGDMDNDEQRLQEQQLLHQHYGDNMLSPYKRPENHYIHHIEPSDVELYDSVEYDMDEQDKVWLQLYNQERSKELLGDISPFLFETIMDKLEKEWFHLIKDAPKPSEPQVTLPEDSACAVCDDTEVENSNAIVFCDGCNVAVHQDCYGIPYIPEGQWLCRKCMISPEFPVSCLFCPNEGGAFKQTNTNQWGHLLCAIWIPEIGVSNTIYMEPIDMIENVPKSRWKLTCFICRKKQGACIQCDNKHCFSAFHVTCAKSARLCMKMTTHSSEGVVLKAYCDKHTPKEHNHVLDVPPVLRGRGRGRGRANSSSSSSAGLTRDQFNNNKVARAHQHHYTTGAPIPPDSILVKIDNLPCVRTSSIRKRAHVVTAIAHYWSLKRESRRGAPLLKRLHLEPWTASSKYTTDENDYYLRKSVIVQLRADLDRVRILSEQVQKRERQKLDRTKKQKMYIDMILYPLEYVLRPILTQFMEIDRKKVFLNHVTAEEAPDYSSVIEKSMCFSEIYGKLSLHQYTHLSQFKEDVSLIWENSMQYNKTDTSFYKVAIKLKTASEKLFAVAEEKMSRYELNEGMWDVPVDETLFDYKAIVEEEEEEDVDVEELSQDSPQETAVVKSSEPIAPREPKYRRKKKFHQANPRLLNSLRKRNVVPVKPEEKAPKESTDQSAVTEANVQSLNIQGSQPSNTSTTLAIITTTTTETETATATATATKTAPSSNELQQSSTSYFAEQRRKEQQRKEEREKKRIAEELEKQRLAQEEEQRALAEKEQDLKLKREKRNVYERERRARKKLQLQEALNEDKQTSPPAEIIQYDIETMQPIYVPRPPTPPPAAAAAPAAASVENPTTTDMDMDTVTDMKVDTTTATDTTVVNTEAAPSQPQPPALFPIMAPLPPSHSEPSQPAEANTSVSTEVSTSASTTEPIATATTSVEVKVEAASSSSSSSSQKVGKKRKAPSAPIPRKTRSAGLKASIEELTKRPKISHEARTLFASYNGVSHLERPTEVYKEDRNKSAPVGWVYLEEDDDEDESATTTTTTTTTTATLATTADHRVTIEPAAPSAAEEVKSQKYVKRKRNDIPVPNFKRGEIVWAQVTGYPSHPAKFLNLPDDQCSPNILKSRRYQGDVLVEFLCVPENHKWGWVRRSSICEVGDLEEDKKRLSESLAKKPKRNVFIQEAKEGYRHAGQILGLDPEPAIEAVFNQVVEKKKKKAGKRSS